MEQALVDFDRLYEDVTPECKNFLQSILKDSFQGFLATILDQGIAINQNPFNRRIAEYGHCPPPKCVSLSAFDDLVIKILGDQGGVDDMLWRFADQLPSRETPINKMTNKNTIESSQLQSPLQESSNDLMSNRSKDQIQGQSQGHSPRGTTASVCGRDSVMSIDEFAVDEGESNSNSNSHVESTGGGITSDALAALLLRYWASVVNSLASSEWMNRDDSIKSPPTSSAALEAMATLLQHHSQAIRVARENVNVTLGKRGRYFLDIWEEDEFVHRNKLRNRFRSLRCWEDLFHPGYGDNHDGCYRDWLLSELQERKKFNASGNSKFKKRRSSDPIFWSALLAPSECGGLSHISPPPVPVAIHHPAAWCIRSPDEEERMAQTNEEDGKINVHCIHPAYIRTKHIVAQHERLLPTLNKNKNSNTAFYTDFKNAKKKPGNAAALAPHTAIVSIDNVGTTSVEDVDDFNLYASSTQQQLMQQESFNFVRLARLQHIIALNETPLRLEKKRERLERIVYRAVLRMEPTSVERVVYAFKPSKAQTSSQAMIKERGGLYGDTTPEGVIRLDVDGNVIPRKPIEASIVPPNTQPRYNTRCLNTEGIVAAALRPNDVNANFRRDLLGASAMRQVQHGALLGHCLQVGAEVEVLLEKGKLWQVATITRIMYDGDLPRHIKVVPEDCTAFDSIWISVEDGRIAPYGTHLRVVKSLSPTPLSPALKTSNSLENIPNNSDSKSASKVIVKQQVKHSSEDSKPVTLERVNTDARHGLIPVNDDHAIQMQKQQLQLLQQYYQQNLIDMQIRAHQQQHQQQLQQQQQSHKSIAQSKPAPSSGKVKSQGIPPSVSASERNNYVNSAPVTNPHPMPPMRPKSIVASQVLVPAQTPALQVPQMQQKLQSTATSTGVASQQSFNSPAAAAAPTHGGVNGSAPPYAYANNGTEYVNHTTGISSSKLQEAGTNGYYYEKQGNSILRVPINQYRQPQPPLPPQPPPPPPPSAPPSSSATSGASGGTSGSSGSSSARGVRTKLPLPLGATSHRDLIPAVRQYTPLGYSSPPAATFIYGAGVGVGGVGGHGLAGVTTLPLFTHYECEPETDPRPRIFDSVGFHSASSNGSVAAVGVNNGFVNMNMNLPRSMPIPPPPVPPRMSRSVAQTQPNGYTAALISDTTSNHSASSSCASVSTFRLGPRGSITKN